MKDRVNKMEPKPKDSYRETQVKCCGTCSNMKSYGLRSYACKFDESIIYDEDEGFEGAYNHICNLYE